MRWVLSILTVLALSVPVKAHWTHHSCVHYTGYGHLIVLPYLGLYPYTVHSVTNIHIHYTDPPRELSAPKRWIKRYERPVRYYFKGF